MNVKVSSKELAALADFINDCYVGDLPSLCNDLTKALYLLHHVKRDEAHEDEIDEACFMLYHIHQHVFAAYQERVEANPNN